jgi:hypothetical protein
MIKDDWDGVESSHYRKVPLWFKILVVFFLLLAASAIIGSLIALAVTLED